LAEVVTSQTSDHKRTLEEEISDLKFTIGFFKNRIDQMTVLAMERNKLLKKFDERFNNLEREIKEINRKVK